MCIRDVGFQLKDRQLRRPWIHVDITRVYIPAAGCHHRKVSSIFVLASSQVIITIAQHVFTPSTSIHETIGRHDDEMQCNEVGFKHCPSYMVGSSQGNWDSIITTQQGK